MELIINIVMICAVIFGIGYSLYHLFWFIWNNRAEEGKSYANPNVQGSARKELLIVLWKTIRVVLIIAAIVFLLHPLVEKEDEPEEEVVLTEKEEIAGYWEEKYKIPKGLLQTVDSSAISEMGYDSKKSALIIRFKSSGKAYAYIDFPVSEWNSFQSAKSIGTYYNKNIKGKYKSYRLVGQ